MPYEANGTWRPYTQEELDAGLQDDLNRLQVTTTTTAGTVTYAPFEAYERAVAEHANATMAVRDAAILDTPVLRRPVLHVYRTLTRVERIPLHQGYSYIFPQLPDGHSRTLNSINVVSQDDDTGRLKLYVNELMVLEAPVGALMFSARQAADATAFTQFFSDVLRRLEVDKQTKNLELALELLDRAVETWRDTIRATRLNNYQIPERGLMGADLSGRDTPITVDLFFTERVPVQ